MTEEYREKTSAHSQTCRDWAPYEGYCLESCPANTHPTAKEEA